MREDWKNKKRFDYKKFREKNTRARLLFVAHREEILKKSREELVNKGIKLKII